MRVCSVLKMFIDEQYQEFDLESINLLMCFIRGKLFNIPKNRDLLWKSLQRKLSSNRKDISLIKHPAEPILKKCSSVDQISSLMKFSSKEIAQQFCLIDFELFKSIKPNEFFHCAWTKPEAQHLAPNIRMMIDRFNLVTRWVITTCLKPEKPRERARRIEKIIDISSILFNMRNFFSLQAIIGALQSKAIERLNRTRKKIGNRYKLILNNFNAFLSPEGNFKQYRKMLSALEFPCIPYIGIHLKDLMFLYECGVKSTGENMINMKQQEKIYGVIFIIQQYQEYPYKFSCSEPVYHILQSMEGSLQQRELLEFSEKREPKLTNSSFLP